VCVLTARASACMCSIWKGASIRIKPAVVCPEESILGRTVWRAMRIRYLISVRRVRPRLGCASIFQHNPSLPFARTEWTAMNMRTPSVARRW
jgi:hypothetical protein